MAVKLQLQAGCCILKLARHPVFDDVMSYKHLHTLSVLVLVSVCLSLSILTAIFQVDLGEPVPECLHS